LGINIAIDSIIMKIVELLESSRYVTIHRELNSRLFAQQKMRPEVRLALMKIAQNFKQFIDVKMDIVDVTVTGSNAAYAYTAHSDLDLHLIVQGQPSTVEREFYDAKKGLWNQQHDVLIRGLPVEVYVQGAEDPHHSSGVYSVMNDQWVVKPTKQKPTIDDVSVAEKLRYFTREIQGAINDNSRAKAEATRAGIAKMRKTGLAKTGEWSAENIAYKTLRNQGLIDQLSSHIQQLLDQELSLESSQGHSGS
jgi:hypothetical protein